MQLNKSVLWIVFVFVLLVIGGCAGVNPVMNVPGSEGNVAGFWQGLWNGLTCWIAFFGSLFSDNISIYEVHNNGNWYDFGFVLGTGVIFEAIAFIRAIF